MKKFTLLLFTILLVASCKFGPYLNYYHPSKKTHLATFSKWDHFIGSTTNPLRSSFDVTCYDWSVSVQPVKKVLHGTMKIYFNVEETQDSLLLDLQRKMKIDRIQSSVPLKKVHRKKDAVFFVFERDLQKGESILLEITYHGKPVRVLGHSAVNRKKDATGKPWICTATQGIGPHDIMPCNQLLNDEADSCFIRVGTPKGLITVSNGKLDSITQKAGETIYNWSVKNPINIYNISFNTGDYVQLEKKYTDINGVNRELGVYALRANASIADTFYDQAPLMMKNFEQLYGTYPWWNDGCKFIESCLHNSAMEHQSAISMGEGYRYDYKKMNTTLAHEISHEWWGNNITAFDYADLWLHEGFASYSEFLTVEALYGKPDYNGFIRFFSAQIKNERPILKTPGVLYNSLANSADQDIYYKGAMLLHTLRMQLNNDPLFLGTLKKAQVQFAKSNITTAQFIAFFNAETKTDFTPFFDVYLEQVQPPVLECYLVKTNPEKAVLFYKWQKEPTPGFSMKVLADLGEKLRAEIYPSGEWQELPINPTDKIQFDIAQFGYILVKKVNPPK